MNVTAIAKHPVEAPGPVLRPVGAVDAIGREPMPDSYAVGNMEVVEQCPYWVIGEEAGTENGVRVSTPWL